MTESTGGGVNPLIHNSFIMENENETEEVTNTYPENPDAVTPPEGAVEDAPTEVAEPEAPAEEAPAEEEGKEEA